jgi:hypothetical protein
VRAIVVCIAVLTLGVGSLRAQEIPDLLTAPERTRARETTSYGEVVEFMRRTAEASPLIYLRTFGYSLEGRPLPLAIVGRLPDGTPEAVRASGRTVVYLQGNIHAGEVEGKEVLLMLLRELAEEKHTAMLDSLVLLIAPVLNADGTEQVRLTNRPLQHGPVGGMGTRANAQGLNINRDHMKLDTPEARSFVLLMRDYDPHIAVDLHTTNGTIHGYHLTYSPPLHPNTDPRIMELLRGRLFPEMRENARDRLGWQFYFYGNVQGEGQERGWYTFDYRALFNNNYLGLRNRLGLLSEAYSYATFPDRIVATRHFVDEVLRFAHTHASEIRTLVAAVDAESIVGSELALRAVPERSAAPVEILLGGAVEERNPFSGATMLRRTDEIRPERMWEFGTFRSTLTERVPRAYLVPEELRAVLEVLSVHGVRVERVEAPIDLPVERFRITAQRVATSPFEGRIERTIEGEWEPVSGGTAAGMIRVPLDQPLGRLVFSLLEPRSADGLATWDTLGDDLEGASEYPILRIP